MDEFILLPVFHVLLCLVLFLTVRFCKRWRNAARRNNDLINEVIDVAATHSGASLTSAGVNKDLINSLPVIQFSSLSCSSCGLEECAICLAKFEDTDALHLLPKCRHAFHAECIRQWLADHWSCPVCRQMVEAEDFRSFPCLDGLLNPGSLEQTIQIDNDGCVQSETGENLVKEIGGCSNSSGGANTNKDDSQINTSVSDIKPQLVQP
ncbi:RING-H2 finger protein ATL43-like [Nymphaea colorata]|nr:RING-H2 finger protein ATL43-like [Nymphaea colorata]